MRGLIEELPSPNPLERSLPGLYQQDDFTCRFVRAFDDVVAPVFSTLDNFAAYIDPDTAPEDFLGWVAGWFGLTLDATWTVQRRRQAVREIIELYQWRGTIRGLRAQVALFLGVEPEVEEGGGVAWSPVPGAQLPGAATNRLVVRVRVPDPDAIDRARLDALVTAAKPAHLVHEVEVLQSQEAAAAADDATGAEDST